MLKHLIIVLIIVILVAIKLNFNDTSPTQTVVIKNSPNIIKIPIKQIKKESNKTYSNINTKIDKKCSRNMDNNLSIEIDKMLKKAHTLFRNSQDAQAIELYQKIIKKTQNSHDIKLLEQFTEACMQMAFLYQIYPNSDKEMAIEAYSKVIDKFKDSKNSKLLEYYITATVQQAYLFDKDERADIYDALIEKFENTNDIKLQKRVEELLINKSFELMGKEDEEAMDILDKIINKYENREEKENLPESVDLAILNNLELSIITANDDEKYVELANKYLSKSPETKPIIEMLEIIKNSQYLEQDEAFNQWLQDNKKYHFEDWSFEEMKRWVNNMDDPETKKRVKKYLDAFENYKYNQRNSKNGLDTNHKTDITDLY